jgi:hypothetical protein
MIRIVGRIPEFNIDPPFCIALRLLYSEMSANDVCQIRAVLSWYCDHLRLRDVERRQPSKPAS